jgi:chaperone required for assembly of F1-ATPase
MSLSDSAPRPKRFYKTVTTAAGEGGFAILLDGRAVKTPAGARLALPSQALAELVAAEWDAQEEFIVLPLMGATRLAYTVIDRITQARAETAAELARYAGADLICYFAEAPQALVALQRQHWEPLLDWAQTTHGLRFERASGIIHQAQPQDTLDRALALAQAQDDFTLAGLAFGAALFGSAVLTLALQGGRLSGQAAFDLSRLDQAFQEERWGIDDEAAARTDWMQQEALLLERWFLALKG